MYYNYTERRRGDREDEWPETTPPNKKYISPRAPPRVGIDRIESTRTLHLSFFLFLLVVSSYKYPNYFAVLQLLSKVEYTSIPPPFYTMSLSNKLAITDVDLKGKRVLIRVSRIGYDLLQSALAQSLVGIA